MAKCWMCGREFDYPSPFENMCIECMYIAEGHERNRKENSNGKNSKVSKVLNVILHLLVWIPFIAVAIICLSIMTI